MKTEEKQRSFTIRLGNLENIELDKLKSDLRISTDNGVIRFLIMNYRNLNKNYNDERSKRMKAERDLNSFQEEFKEIKRVFKLLSK